MTLFKQNIILAEVYVSIPWVFHPMQVGLLPRVWGKRPLLPPHTYIYNISKQNKQLELFIFTQNMLLR